MKPAFDAARLATELRGTAHDLRLCLAELLAEDRSLLADLLCHFPTRIEELADGIAERPIPEFTPGWPAREASAEMHFAALLARQRWWVNRHEVGRRA
ncbi:hypothetical protein ABWL39_07110 [Chitinivorax sp. PXF-14]|uniref:hypothetical protein n=1 Tax=Chitinivorax sp. PXF-14 TaxID=3230488 RepID=UPI003467DD89